MLSAERGLDLARPAKRWPSLELDVQESANLRESCASITQRILTLLLLFITVDEAAGVGPKTRTPLALPSGWNEGSRSHYRGR